MKTVYLERVETSDQGTFGRLKVEEDDQVFYFFTGELPWRDNQQNISCIPAGTYKVIWSFSPKFKRRLHEITKVPSRTSVRIHGANLMGDVSKGYKSQLNGCIALGLRLGSIDGQKAVLLSSPAMRQFETLMNGESFMLEIRDDY